MKEDIPTNHQQDVNQPHESILIRRPWISIVFIMVFYFLFQLIPQLIVALSVDPIILETYPFILKIVEFISLGILLLVFVPFVMHVPNNNIRYSDYMRDVQVSTTRFKGIIVGFVTTIIMFLLAYGATYLGAWVSKWYLNDPRVPQVVVDPSYLLDPEAPLNVYYALSSGIWEEVAFRGIILILLLKKYKLKKAIVIDGILFGLFHLLNLFDPTITFLQGGSTQEEFLSAIMGVGFQVIFALSLGIAWAYLFVKSKSLIPSIIGHYLWNAFGRLVSWPNIIQPWIRLTFLTILGIGILPAILDIILINAIYREKSDLS